MFSNILLARINKTQGNEVIQCDWVEEIPDIFTYQWDRYLVTTGVKSGNSVEYRGGLVVHIPKTMIKAALGYFFKKGTDEIKHFCQNLNIKIFKNK